MQQPARRFLTAEWRYLAMLNFQVDPELLLPLVPAGTELDEFNGKTLASIVGFMFLDTRVGGVAFPLHRNFEEVNLRFYVRRRGPEGIRRGVVFVREIVPRRAIASIARLLYGEKYVAMRMRHSISHVGQGADARLKLEYSWGGRQGAGRLAVQATGAPEKLVDRSEQEFITEHYWGYSKLRDGGTVEYAVEHPRWRVWRAERYHFDCDIQSIYGRQFVEPLSARPDSVFIADGSEVSVFRGRRI